MVCDHRILSGMTLQPKWMLEFRPETNSVTCIKCEDVWTPGNKTPLVAANEGPYGNQNPPNWIPNVDPWGGY